MNKLTDFIKRYGIAGCLHKVIYRIGKSLGITYIQYFAYFKTLPETIDAHSLPPYRRMTLDDFKKQAESDKEEQPKPNSEWFNNRKLKQIEGFINKPGFAYYGIYEGEELICYGAVSMDYDNFIYQQTNPKAAYLFDDYTQTRYRGRGLHQKIVGIREYEAWKQGKSVTFAYVQSDNRASAKGFERCGYVARIKLIYRQVGRHKPFSRKSVKI